MRQSKNEDGFVLFSVLWIAGLLAVVASTFAIAVRLHVKGEANISASVEAELAADGLARLIAFRLASASFSEKAGLPVNGEAIRCRLGEGRRALVSIQDQGGLVDLNRAPVGVLAAVVERNARNGSGEALAEALADFRDADNDRFAGRAGAAEETLIADGPGMKNAPFQSVDEIEQVIPEGIADLAMLKTVFTVHSRQDGIDPSAAPEPLRALTEVDLGQAQGAIPLAPSQRKTFEIGAQVTTESGSTFRRMAMVTLLREPSRPFAVLEWRQGSTAISFDKEQAGEQACEELRFE